MNLSNGGFQRCFGGSLFVHLPTFDEEHEDGFDQEKCVPARVDYAGGLQIALLSAFDAAGERSDIESPEVYIARRPNGWCVLIARHGGGDADLMVTIPDVDSPIIAEPAALSASVRWIPFSFLERH